MIPLEKYPLLTTVEDVLLDELDRQHMLGKIDGTLTGDTYFDRVDGAVVGAPDWSEVVKRVVEAWEAGK